MSASIIKSTLIVSAIVVASKILGFVRQLVVAMFFGATAGTDAFYASSSFINSFASLVFSAVSVTLLSQYMKAKESASENKLLYSALLAIIPVSCVLSLILCVGATPLSHLLAPSMSEAGREMLIFNLRVMSVVLIPYGLLLILNVALEANDLFGAGRIPTLLQNACVVIAVLIFGGTGRLEPLIVALTLSFFLSFAVVAITARKFISIKGNKIFLPKEMKALALTALPLLAGNAIYEVNSIADSAIASLVGEGAISALTYGQSINEIVSGVVIYAISTVLFARFAAYAAKSDSSSLLRTLDDSLSALAIVLLPLTVAVLLCAQDIVALLFLRGSFTESVASATSGVVVGYALGFLPTAIRSIFTKAHYSLLDTRTPMLNGIVCVTANVILSYILSQAFGVGGIGAATSFAMVLSSVIYAFSAHRLIGWSPKGLLRLVAKCLISVCLAGLLSFAIHNALALSSLNFYLVSFLRICAVFFVCFAVYLAALKAMRCKELSVLAKRIIPLFRKA